MHLTLLPTLADQYPRAPSRDLTNRSSDHELIERIARSDRDAMHQVFRRFKTPVYRFALRLVANEHSAQDLVSEVFMDVWRTAGAFEGRSEVSTWLLAITRNKALALMRRRSPEALDDDVAEEIEDEADGPEVAVQKQQVRSILLECIERLSPMHREIVDLVYYHGRSIEQVANILNIPCATVKTRMFYARNRLAQMLTQAGHDRLCN
jgi:RNA polymerase sigma-70 factor, ECF subfamily